MIDDQENKKRLDLLKVARQLLIQDYLAKRDVDQKQWMIDNEMTWRSTGKLLPYPTSPIYPSEAEVVARALELYNLTTPTQPVVTQPVAEAVSSPTNVIVDKLAEAYNKPVAPLVDTVVSTPWKTYLTPSDQDKILDNKTNELTTRPTMDDIGITATDSTSGDSDNSEEPEIEAMVPHQAPLPTTEKVEAEPVDDVSEFTPPAEKVEAEPVDLKKQLQANDSKHQLLRNVLSSWLDRNKDK